MSTDREYEEKRDFIRMFVDAKVEITDPESGKRYEGDSINLSAGGVAFVSSQPFDIDKTLDVKVSSVQSKLPPLSAELVVIRCEKQSDDHYEIAGSIQNVSQVSVYSPVLRRSSQIIMSIKTNINSCSQELIDVKTVPIPKYCQV